MTTVARHRARSGLPRAVGLVAASWAALGLLAQLFRLVVTASWTAVSTSGPDAPADLVVLGAGLLGLLLTAWLALGVLLSVVAHVPGALGRASAACADRWAPALLRRGVALALGAAMVAAVPAVAHADPPRPAWSLTTQGAVSTPGVPDPGFSVTVDAPPPRPASTLGPLGPAPSTAPAPSTTPSPAPPASAATVRVERGDSLWRIAARHLGPAATRAQIAREWPRWYAANRAVIGADPDLIRAGQRLTAPAAATSSASSASSAAGR